MNDDTPREHVVRALVDAMSAGMAPAIEEHTATGAEVLSAFLSAGRQALEIAIDAGADRDAMRAVVDTFRIVVDPRVM